MYELLHTLVKQKFAGNHYSLRRAAGEMGISHMAIKRFLETGGPASLDTIAALSNWVGVEPASVIGFNKSISMEDSDLLKAFPALADQLESVWKEIKVGNLDPGLIEELIEYIQFKRYVKGLDGRKENTDIP